MISISSEKAYAISY